MSYNLSDADRGVIERAISEAELSCQYALAEDLRAILTRASAVTVAEPISKFNATQLRWMKDGIRNAYDTGYNDARNVRSVPGDSAPGYRGRAVEKESGEHYAAAIERAAAQQQAEPPIYTGKQATNCAVCGEYKHTPLRIDRMGGYVCLTCIDKELAQPRQQAEPALVQMRMRPMWREEGGGWTEWGNTTEAAAQDYERHPIYQDWQYEVRRLYLGAQSGQRTGVVEDAWQIADLVLGHAEGLRVSSPLETRNGFGSDVEHCFEVSDGVNRFGVVIILTRLKAAAPTQQQEGSQP